MKEKFMSVVLVVFALIFSVFTFELYARECGETKSHSWDLEEKFSKNAYFILQNEEGLGLSDEQVAKIKDLKIGIKKDLIGKTAELDIVAIDIKSELHKDAIDREVVNNLIEKKYDLKKEKAKSLVNAYATLKGILTEEQKEKMEDLWKDSKSKMMQGSMMKGEAGHPMMKDKMKSHKMGR